MHVSVIFAQNHRDSIDVLNYNINLQIPDIHKNYIEGITYLTVLPKFNKTKTLKLDLLKLKVY